MVEEKDKKEDGEEVSVVEVEEEKVQEVFVFVQTVGRGYPMKEEYLVCR